jgi:biopolymer transport protein ExbD
LRRNRVAIHEEPVINLTPLIDVVFVILIMFIVIAPLLEVDQVELASAPILDKSVSVQNESPITIHVNQNNQILLNRQRIAIDQLPLSLRQLKERHPKIKPQVFHDKRAQFGTYQAVKNAVEAAGFQQMDIILKPQTET